MEGTDRSPVPDSGSSYVHCSCSCGSTADFYAGQPAGMAKINTILNNALSSP